MLLSLPKTDDSVFCPSAAVFIFLAYLLLIEQSVVSTCNHTISMPAVSIGNCAHAKPTWRISFNGPVEACMGRPALLKEYIRSNATFTEPQGSEDLNVYPSPRETIFDWAGEARETSSPTHQWFFSMSSSSLCVRTVSITHHYGDIASRPKTPTELT